MGLAQKRYYEKNREKLNEKARKYYSEHKERYKEINTKWREENRSIYNKYASTYQKMRREKIRNATVRKCKFCGRSFTPKKTLNQIFCSSVCRDKQNYKDFKERKNKNAN